MKWFVLTKHLNLIDLGIDLPDANGRNGEIISDAADSHPNWLALIHEPTFNDWRAIVNAHRQRNAWFTRDGDQLMYVGEFNNPEGAADAARQMMDEFHAHDDLALNIIPIRVAREWF